MFRRSGVAAEARKRGGEAYLRRGRQAGTVPRDRDAEAERARLRTETSEARRCSRTSASSAGSGAGRRRRAQEARTLSLLARRDSDRRARVGRDELWRAPKVEELDGLATALRVRRDRPRQLRLAERRRYASSRRQAARAEAWHRNAARRCCSRSRTPRVWASHFRARRARLPGPRGAGLGPGRAARRRPRANGGPGRGRRAPRRRWLRSGPARAASSATMSRGRCSRPARPSSRASREPLPAGRRRRRLAWYHVDGHGAGRAAARRCARDSACARALGCRARLHALAPSGRLDQRAVVALYARAGDVAEHE